MVHKCAVPGCPNSADRKDKSLKFHRLPFQNTKLLETWLNLIGKSMHEVTVNSRICSAHFIGGSRKRRSQLPEIFPWNNPKVGPSDIENVCAPQISSPPSSLSTSPLPSPSLTTNTCPACIVFHDHSYCKQEYTHSHVQSQAMTMLSSQVGSDIPLSTTVTIPDSCTVGCQTCFSDAYFCIENIVNDNAAIHFYTGFYNYDTLYSCYQFLGDAAYHLKYWGNTKSSTMSTDNRGPSRSLSPLNEFFLVLCRLRCGLMEYDLAFRFGISQSTVSRIIITWVNFLYFKFKDINIWPSKQQILHFMPKVFKENYPTTRCIIDATEIFIQSPSNPQAQQITFSSYKNHNTFKALVCVTPAGVVSFISKLYGGNISDRELTIKSGILNLIEPGDSIMADRGFTIADLCEAKGARLNIPPMKTKDQFTEAELLTTRRIASLRIHVERAIGRIKNYKILNDIPITIARVADQIFYVCAILSVFNPPLCSYLILIMTSVDKDINL